MAKLSYFYDNQIERVVKHLIRMFGGFSVLSNYDDLGAPIYKRVPCRYGDISRQVASIIQGNSENTLKSAPFMTVSINRLNLSREQVRAPLTEDVVAAEAKYDPTTGQYIDDELQDIYQIKRQNPVPWDLEFNVDIWTTTLENKFELVEQIATLFNPSLDLQISSNPYDWTSKMIVENTGFNYSSRAFPQGSEYNLDIATFNFKTTIWLSLPVSVSRAKLVQQITANFDDADISSDKVLTNITELATDIYAPSNHTISVYRSSTDPQDVFYMKILNAYGSETTDGLEPNVEQSNIYSWDNLFMYYYGNSEYPAPQVRLLTSLEETGIIGGIELTAEPNIVKITIDTDTLEPTTDDPINGIIDPRKYDYDDMITRPDGTRFVVHDSVDPFDLQLWNTDSIERIAQPGDIIEKIAGTWEVNTPATTPIIVDNLANGKRYKYLSDIGWHELIKSKYSTGFWRLGFPTP